MSPTFLLLLIQVATGCCLFKGSTAEKEKQVWKRKNLTTSHTKVQILQNIANSLENTVDTMVARGFLRAFRRTHAAAVAHQAGEGQSGAGENMANT